MPFNPLAPKPASNRLVIRKAIAGDLEFVKQAFEAQPLKDRMDGPTHLKIYEIHSIITRKPVADTGSEFNNLKAAVART